MPVLRRNYTLRSKEVPVLRRIPGRPLIAGRVHLGSHPSITFAVALLLDDYQCIHRARGPSG